MAKAHQSSALYDQAISVLLQHFAIEDDPVNAATMAVTLNRYAEQLFLRLIDDGYIGAEDAQHYFKESAARMQGLIRKPANDLRPERWRRLKVVGTDQP